MAQRWLLKKFTEFFVEVQRQKQAIAAGKWAFREDDPVPFDPQNPSGRGPNPVWESIAFILRRQAEEARESGASGSQLYREAQYAMAALADELFIVGVKEWPGRDDWHAYPLERALFGTQVAGEDVFQRMDRLLARMDPGERDLAEIYFNILTLGFRGRYAVLGKKRASATSIPPEITEYCTRLHRFFAGRGEEHASRVSPQAYEHTDARTSGGLIPSAAQALILLGLVVAVLWLSSRVLNKMFVSGIVESIEKIERDTEGS